MIARVERIGPDEIRIYDRFFADEQHLHALRESILAQRMKHKQSVASLSIGGWKSEIRILDEIDKTDAGAALERALTHVLTTHRPIVSSWAMVNERGARHPWHTHQIAKLTGVFFVCADSDQSPIELGDPGDERGHRKYLGAPGQRLRINAVPGRLILFPGRVWHQVPEVTGDGVRISIAFDVH